MIRRLWNKLFLYPLYGKLRHHLAIAMPVAERAGLLSLGKPYFSENHDKNGFVYNFDNLYIEIKLELDSNNGYLEILLNTMNFNLGHSGIYADLATECVLRQITRDSAGRIKIIFSIDVWKRKGTSYDILEMCSEILKEAVQLHTLLKETEDERVEIRKHRKTEKLVLSPFEEKIKPKKQPEELKPFSVILSI